MNIDQNAMSCTHINKFVSTSSTNQRRAFSQISESFSELTTLFQIIVALGLGMRGGGVRTLIQYGI